LSFRRIHKNIESISQQIKYEDADMTNKICAITSYFNPSKSKRRLENYKAFAKELNLLLVTVELSTDEANFELNKSDADIYIPVVNSAVLWHKESLLNIALKYVPDHIDYIVWLDCDIIFDNKNWAADLPEYLEKYNLVQLFSSLYDLHKDDLQFDNHKLTLSGYSIAYLNSTNSIHQSSLNPKTTSDMRSTLFGLAWGAKKNLLTTHGFYDAMIVGSGDRSMFCAGIGEYNVIKDSLRLNEKRFNHFLDWATPFHKSVDSKIGYLQGKLFHLWHGEINNRKYLERHIEFSELNFNPFCDIHKMSNGTWNWGNNTEACQLFLKNYFFQRKEV